MQDRINEHDRDIRLACTETFVVQEHAHNTRHKPHRDIRLARTETSAVSEHAHNTRLNRLNY